MRDFLRRPWAPLLLVAAWLLATAWLRPLALPDEGRYVGVAWHMLRSGDWLVPRLDGLPYFHKPPLFYWITAGSLSLFGPSEWAARAAPLLGAFTGATALYLFVRRWRDDSLARWSLLALVTQPLFFIGGQFANLDMLVAGCIGACVLAFAHAALSEEEGRRSPRALAAGYVFMALGLLAKGLIGIVLPGLVLVAWLLPRRQWRLLLRLVWVPGILLFLAIAAPWFVAMQLHFADFSHYFFVVQHFSRFAGSGFNNKQPFWFYGAVLLVLALPWSVWLVGRGARAAQDDRHRALLQLAWTWLAAMLLFFSLPASKLVGYILPAAAPLAWLAAEALRGSANAARAQRRWRVGAAAAIVACVSAVAGGAVFGSGGSTKHLARALQPLASPGERLVFLHAYYFDLPFYAHWGGPVEVVEDWDDPELTRRDNWRREIADAGQFEPDQARRLLRLPADVPEAFCGVQPMWVVGRRALADLYPVLHTGEIVATQRDLALWRVPARGVTPAACGETPIPNPADRS